MNNRRQLEIKADRVEAVFASHKIAARCTGGEITPDGVKFDVIIAANICPKIEAYEFEAVLNVPSVTVGKFVNGHANVTLVGWIGESDG